MTLEYVLTSLVVILLPGTGVLYTLALGLGLGFRAGVLAACGCTLGILPQVVASIAGLSAILHASAVAFQLVKYLGVAYLLYMAWTILNDRTILRVSENNAAVAPVKIVLDGFMLNILNPKLSLFFLAFLPQFVPLQTSAPSMYMLGLAAVFMLLTFMVFVVYGAFAAAARNYVVAKPGMMVWLKRGFAGAFGVLGLRLALSDR